MNDFTRLITNKNVIDLACRVPENVQEQLMAMAIETAVSEVRHYDVNNVVKGGAALTAANLLDLIGLYISVVRVFMETDEKQFCNTMTAVGFSGEFIEKFPLKHKSQAVSLILSRSQGGIQKLSSFKWRVDISFTCGIRRLHVPPKVIISLLLNNGQKLVFEVDQHAFHQMRFYISLALKELAGLKSSPALKNKMLL